MTEAEALEENLLHRFNVGDLLHRSACRHPEAAALRFERQDVTYRDLDALAARMGQALRRAGLGPGDVVAVLGLNSPEFVALWFGASAIGAALLPLNALLRGPELVQAIGRAQARALMVDASLWPLMAGDAASLGAVELCWFLGPDAPLPPGFRRVEEVLASEPPEWPAVAVPSDAMATLLFTSGTEAQPKGVVSTHLNWHAALLSAVADLEIGRRQRPLLALPLFHVAGLYVLLATLATGATGVLLRRIEPRALLRAIQEEGVTYLVLPATAYLGLLALPDLDPRDFTRLQHGIVFQYLPGSAMARLGQLAPQVEWVGYWGQSELTPLGASTRGQEVFSRRARPDPIGAAHLPLELQVVDADGRPAARGEVGELVARGPAVMAGYFQDPARTAEAFRGGWHHTGDLAAQDPDGFLYFVDRVKDIIKTGGENVSSQEVEEVMARHPAVGQVSVIGVPDAYWVEAVVAVVVRSEAGERVEAGELLAHCRRELAAFKVPKRIYFAEALPKSPAGKVLKRELQALYGGAS